MSYAYTPETLATHWGVSTLAAIYGIQLDES